MSAKKTGISNIQLFIPDLQMDLEHILEQRMKEDVRWERRLNRAVSVTGQRAFRFTRIWEDTTTMAAQACMDLLETMDETARKQIRYFNIGTETPVDFSKPVSGYVLGMMEKAGSPLPANLSTFQVQHACAGGTLGLLSICGLLQSSGRPEDKGITLTSDISRYEAPSTAEITQGAGAVAILAENNPRLLELDLDSLGLYSQDVDDFFRPLYSVTAKVKGRYSEMCYNENLVGAFDDHCKRIDADPAEELASVDIFALHVPYSLMPYHALQKLFHRHMGLTQRESRDYLDQKGFFASTKPAETIGNIYTGSLYLGLAFSLKERLEKLGEDIAGKKVLLASYGSGSTMALLTATVAPQAPEVIRSWDLEQVYRMATVPEFEVYRHWLDNGKPGPLFSSQAQADSIPEKRFYLEKIREDGYREYSIK